MSELSDMQRASHYIGDEDTWSIGFSHFYLTSLVLYITATV